MKQLPALALGMICALAAPTSATEPPFGPQEQQHAIQGKYSQGAESKRRSRQKAGLPPLESLPRMTKTLMGVPFSQKITVQLPDGRQYRFPVGYFDTFGWLVEDHGDKPLTMRQFGATFWYPTGRHLEVNPLSHPEYDPQEPGRPRPGPGEHTVRIRSIAPEQRTDIPFVPPEQRFRNLTNDGRRTAYIYVEWDGNIRFHIPTDPYRTVHFYRSRAEEDFSLFMTCTLNVPNPQCDTRLHDRRQKLDVRVTFPASEVANWHDIILQTRIMIASWQVIDPAAPAD